MRTFMITVVIGILMVSGVGAKAPQYPISLNIVQLPPTSALLQSAGCSMNCYTGELECKSKQARNFQLAEASDGNTYELQCIPASDSAFNVCPVAMGKYEARRVKEEFRILIPGDKQKAAVEQTFSIISVRQTVAGRPAAARTPCSAK